MGFPDPRKVMDDLTEMDAKKAADEQLNAEAVRTLLLRALHEIKDLRGEVNTLHKRVKALEERDRR